MEKTLHPEFTKMLRSLGDAFPADALLREIGSGRPAVGIRLNRAKGAAAPAAAGARPVGWSGGAGFYLPERPLFALDPAWHQGLYYVQDPSSMALGAVVGELVDRYFATDRTEPLRYLDACAAPGGKTLAALDALPGDAFVLANEYDYRRAAILAENIVKRGAPNVAVSRGDTSRLGELGPQFDIIAADVPCSGEGMMRKDDEAVAQWTPALVAECAARQREIIGKLWPALRSGGFLIYSTCTFNRSENEENVEWIVREYGAESIALTSLPAHEGIGAAIGSECACCRFTPGSVDGEGLFIAVLRKPAGAEEPGRAGKGRRGPRTTPKTAALPAGAADFVRHHLGTGYRAMAAPGGDALWAVREADADFAATLRAGLDLLLCGVSVATERGRELAPTAALTLSTALLSDSMPRVELDYAGAMAYLHGDSLTELPEGTPRGYIALCHGGLPLGPAKCVGRRANNLYPDSWRLRMAAPATPPAPVVNTHLKS